MKDVFISYSNLDQAKMVHLSRRLKNTGFFNPIIVADERKPLKLLSDKVKAGIRDSQIFIPILTRNSLNAQWLNQEIGYALAYSKELCPIVESSVIDSLKGFIHNQGDLPYRYDASDDVDVEKKNYAKACTWLIEDLKISGHGRKSIIHSGKFKIVLPKQSEVKDKCVRISGIGAPPRKHIILLQWLDNRILILQKDIATADPDGKWNNQKCCLLHVNWYGEIWAIAVSSEHLDGVWVLYNKLGKNISPVKFHKALAGNNIPNALSAGKKLIRTGDKSFSSYLIG